MVWCFPWPSKATGRTQRMLGVALCKTVRCSAFCRQHGCCSCAGREHPDGRIQLCLLGCPLGSFLSLITSASLGCKNPRAFIWVDFPYDTCHQVVLPGAKRRTQPSGVGPDLRFGMGSNLKSGSQNLASPPHAKSDC